MNNIQLAKSTNESLQFEKEKKVLMVIMPTAPFHTLISGSVSFPSFTPFTPIFPFSFMSCPVCANSGARRLHRHDDVIQTISPTLEENHMVGLTVKAPDPWHASRPDIRDFHRLLFPQHRYQIRYTFSLLYGRELPSKQNEAQRQNRPPVTFLQLASNFFEMFSFRRLFIVVVAALVATRGSPQVVVRGDH